MSNTQLAERQAPAVTGEQHVLVLLMRDRGNALERVLGVLRRRGPAFSTMNLVATEAPDTARVTVTLQGTRAAADQAIEHLRKLVDVRWATVIPVDDSNPHVLLREFALLRVACDGQSRREVMALAERYGARVVDIADNTLTLEISGSSETIEQLLAQAQPYGIRELTRTGQVAI
ncbi:MAG TPA: acetolactate synthase small subunit [Ktedonobacterales bacterium]|nr:acetolactate synthase small subunit [Ktedonobacterales bacterium]